MVVELGDDYDVPLPPFAPERTAEVEGERGHVGAEHDLFGRAPDPVGERATRLENGVVGFLAGRERPVRVGIVIQEVVGHRLRHLARDLRAAGTVEIGDREPVVPAGERGEVAADLFDAGDGRAGRGGAGEG